MNIGPLDLEEFRLYVCCIYRQYVELGQLRVDVMSKIFFYFIFQPAKEGKVEKKKAPAKKGGAKKGGAGKKKGGKKAAPKKAAA